MAEINTVNSWLCIRELGAKSLLTIVGCKNRLVSSYSIVFGSAQQLYVLVQQQPQLYWNGIARDISELAKLLLHTSMFQPVYYQEWMDGPVQKRELEPAYRAKAIAIELSGYYYIQGIAAKQMFRVKSFLCAIVIINIFFICCIVYVRMQHHRTIYGSCQEQRNNNDNNSRSGAREGGRL